MQSAISRRAVHRLLLGFAGAALVHVPSVHAAPAALKHLSLEELMAIEITSVSGTAERLSSSAAAASVVTEEDIRRSGAMGVPQALRNVPGLHVAQMTSSRWAVSARGFSSVNSDKLLVLSDTRSIYTPLFSGVFWDVQNYVMEDIERIEVIRGPGATLWGANAVNGVINIRTKSARDTQGTYLALGGGSEDHLIASARYGGRAGERGHFRVFGRYFDRDETHSPGARGSDDWRMGHAGFRADWEARAGDAFTLQAEAYRGNVGQLDSSVIIIGRPGPEGDLSVRVSGGNLLGRWQRALDQGADVALRFYYDHTHRNDPSFIDDLHTFDVDLRHRFSPREGHALTSGVNLRHTDSRTGGKEIFALDPPRARDLLVTAFVQDEITLGRSARLTAGSKVGHNEFSGFEVQPSVRLAWDLTARQTGWLAVSRAVRVPTRVERDIAIDASDPAGNPVVRLLGNEDFEAEDLLAYEAGYRWQPREDLRLDLAAFHHRYEDLASFEVGTPFVDRGSGRLIVPIVNRNLTEGEARGAELAMTFSPLEHWRLLAGYAYLDLDVEPHGQDLNRSAFLDGATPRHQLSLSSYLDLPGGWQLDGHFRRLSRIERMPQIASGEGIEGYSELDLRLAWHGSDVLEVALIGRNLLHERHLEFGVPGARGEIERSVYGRLVWRF